MEETTDIADNGVKVLKCCTQVHSKVANRMWKCESVELQNSSLKHMLKNGWSWSQWMT